MQIIIVLFLYLPFSLVLKQHRGSQNLQSQIEILYHFKANQNMISSSSIYSAGPTII